MTALFMHQGYDQQVEVMIMEITCIHHAAAQTLWTWRQYIFDLWTKLHRIIAAVAMSSGEGEAPE